MNFKSFSIFKSLRRSERQSLRRCFNYLNEKLEFITKLRESKGIKVEIFTFELKYKHDELRAKRFDFIHEFVIVALVKLLLLMTRGFL